MHYKKNVSAFALRSKKFFLEWEAIPIPTNKNIVNVALNHFKKVFKVRKIFGFAAYTKEHNNETLDFHIYLEFASRRSIWSEQKLNLSVGIYPNQNLSF